MAGCSGDVWDSLDTNLTLARERGTMNAEPLKGPNGTDPESGFRRVAVPASVTMSIRLAWAIVALSGLTALLTWWLRDDLVRAWARGNSEAMEQLREGGLEGLYQSSISVPELVPLAVTSFVIIAGLTLVLVAFLRGGHGWARWCMVVLIAGSMFSTGVTVSRGLPWAFVVFAALSVVLQLALLRFLFHPDTSKYLRVE